MRASYTRRPRLGGTIRPLELGSRRDAAQAAGAEVRARLRPHAELPAAETAARNIRRRAERRRSSRRGMSAPANPNPLSVLLF